MSYRWFQRRTKAAVSSALPPTLNRLTQSRSAVRHSCSAMEPFRIICETCRSRLKIRSPDVIGEIHACPKCGSMVHIVPPAGWQADATPTDQPAANLDMAAAPALSPTASVIIPADQFAMPATESPAPEVQAAEAPLPVESVAPLGTHLMLWAVGGTVGAFLVGGLAWAIWPSSSDKLNKSLPPNAVARDNQLADQPKSAPPTPPITKPTADIKDLQKMDHVPASTVAANHSAATAPTSPAVNSSQTANIDPSAKHGDVTPQPPVYPSPSQAKVKQPSSAAPPTTATVVQTPRDPARPPNRPSQPSHRRRGVTTRQS